MLWLQIWSWSHFKENLLSRSFLAHYLLSLCSEIDQLSITSVLTTQLKCLGHERIQKLGIKCSTQCLLTKECDCRSQTLSTACIPLQNIPQYHESEDLISRSHRSHALALSASSYQFHEPCSIFLLISQLKLTSNRNTRKMLWPPNEIKT